MSTRLASAPVPPSYAAGFARSRADAAFPATRQGLVFALPFYLGPHRDLVIADVSGTGEAADGAFNGDLTNAAWEVGDDPLSPGYVFRFDASGATDFVGGGSVDKSGYFGAQK